MLPRHVFILHALQDMNGTMGPDRRIEHEVPAPLLDKVERDPIRLVGIGRGYQAAAFGLQGCARLRRQFGEDQAFRHIDGRGDQHEPGQTLRLAGLSEGARAEQCEPSAHRGTDQDLRTVALRADDGERLFEPCADRSVRKISFRFPVAGIIETQIGAPFVRRISVKEARLGGAHIRHEPAEPDEARPRIGVSLSRASQIGNASRRIVSHGEELRRQFRGDDPDLPLHLFRLYPHRINLAAP